MKFSEWFSIKSAWWMLSMTSMIDDQSLWWIWSCAEYLKVDITVRILVRMPVKSISYINRNFTNTFYQRWIFSISNICRNNLYSVRVFQMNPQICDRIQQWVGYPAEWPISQNLCTIRLIIFQKWIFCCNFTSMTKKGINLCKKSVKYFGWKYSIALNYKLFWKTVSL